MRGVRVAVRFEDLLERYEREIYRFAFRMTGNPDEASDVLQETFLRGFRAFSRLPEDANHRAWLYRIAGRSALEQARKKWRRRQVPLEEARQVAETNGDLERIVETRRLTSVLRNAIGSLTTRQRVALLLRKYEGLPYRDVAKALAVSETTARAHVYQAMRHVRRALGQRGTR
jgi:RNA polymerase sigma-70 factor (ECF subfamily)